MKTIKDKISAVVGSVKLGYMPPNASSPVILRKIDNLVCYDWAVSAAALFRNLQNGYNYHIGGIYLEFDNSGSPVDPLPTLSRATTNSYYRNLGGTADFLRVPIMATSGSNSSVNFTGDNVATFIAQSTGTVGQRTTSPLTFSDAAGSRVYGAALVAFLDGGDISSDLIISRVLFNSADQIEKLASSQIYISWSLTFG